MRVLPRERPQVDRRQRHGRAPTTASENECNLGEQLPRAAACRGAHWPPNARLECVRVGKQMPLNACNKMLTSHGRAATRTQLGRKLNSDDRFANISRLKDVGFFGVPELFEATYFTGPRKAGVPD